MFKLVLARMSIHSTTILMALWSLVVPTEAKDNTNPSACKNPPSFWTKSKISQSRLNSKYSTHLFTSACRYDERSMSHQRCCCCCFSSIQKFTGRNSEKESFWTLTEYLLAYIWKIQFVLRRFLGTPITHCVRFSARVFKKGLSTFNLNET